MKIIKLQPIKEWQEKEGKKITGRIWIYVGSLHVGICTPIKNPTGDIPKYRFTCMQYGLLESMDCIVARTMDEIKTDIECTLKEILQKFVKSFSTLKPITK